MIVAFSNDRRPPGQAGALAARPRRPHRPGAAPVRGRRPSGRGARRRGPAAGGLPPARPSRLGRTAKRALDIAVAGTLLALTSPVIAFLAWRIRRDTPGPAFFRQERLGEGQKPFTVLKFRTMAVGTDEAPHREYVRGIMDTAALPADNNLYKLERAQDVTRVGRLAAPDEHRRAAAADQRGQGRDVARRAAALHLVRDRAVRGPPLRPLPGAGGDDRPVAGRGAGALDAQGGARPRRRLRAQLVAAARPVAARAHAPALLRGTGDGQERAVRIRIVGLGYWGPNLARNVVNHGRCGAHLALRPPGAGARRRRDAAPGGADDDLLRGDARRPRRSTRSRS